MSPGNDIDELTTALGVLTGFLYLSIERHQFNPEQAAAEVFSNFEKNYEKPTCVPAIKTCLASNRFYKQHGPIVPLSVEEIKTYLEDFLKHYQAHTASQQ